MGKYESYNDDSLRDVEEILCYIANELAEANRLKRLELRIKSLKHNLPKTQKECEEDSA